MKLIISSLLIFTLVTQAQAQIGANPKKDLTIQVACSRPMSSTSAFLESFVFRGEVPSDFPPHMVFTLTRWQLYWTTPSPIFLKGVAQHHHNRSGNPEFLLTGTFNLRPLGGSVRAGAKLLLNNFREQHPNQGTATLRAEVALQGFKLNSLPCRYQIF